jgi:hypothetical protein
MVRVFVLLLITVAQVTPVTAQRLISGQEMVLPCKRALSSEDAEALQYTQMAFCVGAIAGIAATAPNLELGSRFCVPYEATRAATVAVVVRYLETHTERLQEDFFVLVLQALRRAWPCPKYPM